MTMNSTSAMLELSHILLTAFEPPPPTPITLMVADPPMVDALGAGVGMGEAGEGFNGAPDDSPDVALVPTCFLPVTNKNSLFLADSRERAGLEGDGTLALWFPD
jgi:hypothetical protein